MDGLDDGRTHCRTGRRQRRRREAASGVADTRQQIDVKLDRLLSTHLDGDISVEEYRAAKARLLAEKVRGAEHTKALTANVKNRFEPVIRFVKSLSEATLLASGDDAVAKRDFVKMNGSNLTLGSRRLRWAPRGAWKTVEKHGPFAHHTPAPEISGAGSAGETCPMFSLAEEVGFEPTVSTAQSASRRCHCKHRFPHCADWYAMRVLFPGYG